MRTFTQMQNKPQKPTSSNVARSRTATPGPHSQADPILLSQQMIGSQGMQQMLHAHDEEHSAREIRMVSPRFGHDFSRIPLRAPPSRAIQTKLAINAPGDEYEREADRVAEQVMRTPEPQLQRACACGGECPNCQTKQPGQKHDSTKHLQTGNTEQISAPAIVHEVLAMPGQPLDSAIQGFMEPRFGHDFGRVRVHTDGRAAQSAQAVNALAYTAGRHIVFGANQHAPETTTGKRLLAHELTHVLQQGIERRPETGASVAAHKDRPREHEAANKPADTQVIQRQRDQVLHQEGMDEGGDFSPQNIPATLGTGMCVAMTAVGLDQEVIRLVLGYFESYYPMAHDHLAAYLSGTGERPYDEPVEELFEQNPRVYERISRHIQDDGSRSGIWLNTHPETAPIRQSDYDVEDWRLALGNIDEVRWEVLGAPDEQGVATVRITIRDPYAWSPGDDRFTDCFHELFERQRLEGHAEVFDAWGIGDVRLQITDPTDQTSSE